VIFRLSGGALGGKGEGLELIDRILWQPIPGDEGKPSYFGAALRDAVPSLPIDAPARASSA